MTNYQVPMTNKAPMTNDQLGFGAWSFVGHWCLVIGASTRPSIPFSWLTFLTLILVFGVSLTMFLLLVRRWTTQREWVSLSEWARQKGFRFRPNDPNELPAALQLLRKSNVQIRLHLCADATTVMQLQTDPIGENIEPNRWNVLVRRRPKRQPTPAGLRPASAPASLLDLFELSQFPLLALSHRFSVLATSSTAARAIADSASRTLLPADIGLILMDEWIILDFSTRPFDPIELDRMIALAEQLGQLL